MTPTEIIETALRADPPADPVDVDLQLASWQLATLSGLGPDATKGEVHAVKREADLARGKYASAFNRLSRSMAFRTQREAEREQTRADRAALAELTDGPLELLLNIARTGKPSAAVSACAAILDRFSARVPASQLAVMVLGSAAAQNATAAATPQGDDPCAVALARLRSISSDPSAGDLDVVRSAKILLERNEQNAPVEFELRPVWIVRGRTQPLAPQAP